MNYGAHYGRLIERARARVVVGYIERHHVVPRCLDPNSVETVALTPEEHYTAHLLLVRMFPGVTALLHAACMMAGRTNPHRRNKVYGWMRRKLSVQKRNVPTGRRNNGLLGTKRGPYKSNGNFGRKYTQAHKDAMAKAKLGKKRLPHTQATKDKISFASLGRKKSARHCEAIRVSKLGNNYRSKGCRS